MTTERRRNEETSAPTMHEGVKGRQKVIVDGQPTIERTQLALQPSCFREPLLPESSILLARDIFSLAEREEYIPFVFTLSRVPQEMGNRGGEMDPLANRCSYESVRLWQACFLYRTKQAHFLNRCPK
jgi:hypothetical protein